MARPAKRDTKLTPDIEVSIAKSVADGVPLTFAAPIAGVSPRTMFRWLARGREETAGPFAALVAVIKKAGAEAVAKRVEMIRKAATKGSWQAAAWHLERCHPEHFGSDRRELRELRKTLAELTARISQLAPPDAPDATSPGGRPGA